MFGLTLLFSLAQADASDRVNGGIQAAIYEPGLDFAEAMLEGETFAVDLPEVSSDPGCYDRVGVRNFNLDIPIDQVEAQLFSSGLYFQVDFNTIEGSDMVLFGEDEDFWDVCIGFETDLRNVQVLDVRLEAQVLPYLSRTGDLEVEFVGTPLIDGDIVTDISNFPDDVALWFFEDTIWNMITDQAQDMLGGVIDAYWKEGLLSGELHDIAFGLDLQDIQLNTDALMAGADLNAAWVGEPVCMPGTTEGGSGSEPKIDFGDGEGSSVGLGMTEGNLNRVLRDLWEDGYLCFPDERMDLIYLMVEELFDPSIAGLQAEAIINTEPAIEMTTNGAHVYIDSFSMEVSGARGGKQVSILSADGSLTGKVDLGLDPVLTALTISLHDMDLDLSRFEAKHLVSDAPNAEQHLQRFIEGWLVNWVSEEIEQVSLFNTQFSAFGAIARADQIRWKKNHLILFASLYDEDDPAVDKRAPDTEIDRLDTHAQSASVHVAFSGLDDRDGALGYSYRLNGGSWSGWTTDTEVTLDGVLPGDHLFEVKARDSWLNEDNSPANIHFELGPPEAEATDNSALANCSCSTSTPQRGGVLGIWALAGLVFFARRRRE